MDRLEAMSILLLTVDKGSLSAASRHLRMPLATVSRKLSELETQLGTRLVVRTTRKLTLTDAGVAYVASAKRILEQVDDAERTAAGEFQTPRGDLLVTAPMSFGRLHVLPLVTEFLAVFADINVRLLLVDRNLDLVADHVDMAVRIGELPDSSMIATRVGSMRTVVCASPKLLAAHGQPKSIEALAALPCVSFDALSPAQTWHFRVKGSSALVAMPIRPRLAVSTAEAAIYAAVQGVGVTRVLHYQCAESVRDGSLRIILENAEPAPVPVHLVHAAARSALPLKVRAFLDFVAPHLKKRLQSQRSNTEL